MLPVQLEFLNVVGTGYISFAFLLSSMFNVLTVVLLFSIYRLKILFLSLHFCQSPLSLK